MQIIGNRQLTAQESQMVYDALVKAYKEDDEAGKAAYAEIMSQKNKRDQMIAEMIEKLKMQSIYRRNTI